MITSRPRSRSSAALGLGSAVLAALLLLGIFASSAFGTESPPENTKLPTITPTTPYVEFAVQGGKGTWTGEPTSYSYAWERCGGTCETIVGQTGTTYTPAQSDASKSLVFVVTATNASGSATARSKLSSAVTPSLSWFECGAWGGTGVFEDASCSKKGASNPYSWLRPSGNSTSFTAAIGEGAGETYKFYTTIAGSAVEFQCTSGQGAGTLTNTGSRAEIEGFNLTLNYCAVVKPAGKGCEIEGNKLVFNTLSGYSPESPAKLNPELRIEPKVGGNLTEFHIAHCVEPMSFLNGYHTFTGYFVTQVQSKSSTMYTSPLEWNLYMDGAFPTRLASGTALKAGGKYPVKLDTTP